MNFGDDDRGHYDATFGMAVYGFGQDQCHFTAVFRAAPEGLRASGVHNTDPGGEQDIAGKLLIARTDADGAHAHPSRCLTARRPRISTGFARACRH